MSSSSLSPSSLRGKFCQFIGQLVGFSGGQNLFNEDKIEKPYKKALLNLNIQNSKTTKPRVYTHPLFPPKWNKTNNKKKPWLYLLAYIKQGAILITI